MPFSSASALQLWAFAQCVIKHALYSGVFSASIHNKTIVAAVIAMWSEACTRAVQFCPRRGKALASWRSEVCVCGGVFGVETF